MLQFAKRVYDLASTPRFRVRVVLFGVEEDDLTAAEIKLKGYMDEVPEPILDVGLPFRFHEQQQESSAARAGQLAAVRAREDGLIVQVVHLRIRNVRAQASFGLPGFVQKFAKFT